MKCISLWRPWANLIPIEAKRIETRHWDTKYRGPLAIHAAQKWTRKLHGLCFTPPFFEHLSKAGFIDSVNRRVDLPTGVLCICDLIGTVQFGDEQYPEPERSFGDFAPGRFGWILINVRRLKVPLPFKGRQGFFDVPDELILQGDVCAPSNPSTSDR
jgi:hypothetical protein